MRHLTKTLLACALTLSSALALPTQPITQGIIICGADGCAPGTRVGPPPGSPPYDQRVCMLEGNCPKPNPCNQPGVVCS